LVRTRELIFSPGISAILNAPVRHAGRCLGTLNFCGVADQDFGRMSGACLDD